MTDVALCYGQGKAVIRLTNGNMRNAAKSTVGCVNFPHQMVITHRTGRGEADYEARNTTCTSAIRDSERGSRDSARRHVRGDDLFARPEAGTGRAGFRARGVDRPIAN